MKRGIWKSHYRQVSRRARAQTHAVPIILCAYSMTSMHGSCRVKLNSTNFPEGHSLLAALGVVVVVAAAVVVTERISETRRKRW